MMERLPKDRFEFGKNWEQFSGLVDETRIADASNRLASLLRSNDLSGRSFLDIGCGSGLHSLAALRMGAARVVAIDLDPHSVATTRAVLERFAPGQQALVKEMSAFDLASRPFGEFDVVYSWGVLHHTGAMWDALANVDVCVAPGGTLFIALYDDQGAKSRFWWWVKRVFVALPRPLRVPWALLVTIPFEVRIFLKWTLSGQFGRWVESWTHYESVRGMSRWYDMIDWMGGFPFEVAKPIDVERFYHERGYRTRLVHPTGGAGCVEYVFEKTA